SRRRHTRFSRDWSSDVCSSDLQIIAGAVITFSETDLYPIFDLCGRAIPGMTAVADQAIGGLTMWVLAGFVEVFGVLYALSTVMRSEERRVGKEWRCGGEW